MTPSKTFKPDRTFKKAIVIAKLGYKCNSPDCMWWDKDTQTFGCRIEAALQIDHINGDGAVDRITNPDGWLCVYNLLQTTALEDIQKEYQLLCASCNWIKKDANKESRKGSNPIPTIDQINQAGRNIKGYIPLTKQERLDDLNNRLNPQCSQLLDILINKGDIKLEDK